MPDAAFSVAGSARQLAVRVLRTLRLAPRKRRDAAMDDEMRFHIECEAHDRIRRGMAPDEAWRSARRDFGGIAHHKEGARDVRGVRVIEDMAQDTRYGVRVLRRNVAFTVSVALTFAIGIGCTTAIFSLVNGILLRPLPYTHPESLVSVWERNAAQNDDRNVVSAATFEAWRTRERSFTSVAALVPRPLTLDGNPPERMKGVEVSPDYFRMLGVHPVLGRDFEASEAQNPDVIVLSHAFWDTRFGSDPAIVGKQVSIDGEPMTVIGVMGATFDPPRFGWIADQPLWLPFVSTADKRSWGRFLHVVARLKPGVSIDLARSDMTDLSGQLANEIPGNKGWSSSVVPLSETIVGDVRRPIIVTCAAVALLLLMSMVNVANLVTTFLRRRAHELSLRRAVGATGARLARQQLVLSALLGILGTGLGLALALAGTRALVSLAPSTIPRLNDVRANEPVMLFAALLAMVTTIAVGTAGALRTGTGSSVASAMAATGSGRASMRLRGSRLVAAEVAIGLALTVLAVLMVRSLANLRAVRLGFDASAMVTGRVSLPSVRYPNDTSRSAFFRQLLVRARAIPGVSDASLVTSRPFACCAPTTTVNDPTQPHTEESETVTDIRYADESYFATARIPVLAGAVFDRSERPDGEVHVIVSRLLARALWGDGNPVGRTISMNLYGTTVGRVIGVVGDVLLADPHTPARPSAYLSTERYPSSERDIVVRGTGDTRAMLQALHGAVAAVDPAIPLYMATSLESSISDTLGQDRFTAILLGAFASVALILAAVGVYGVLSADVNRRRKEIGIRIALGAPLAGVTALVLRRAFGPAVAGAAIGVVLAMALARSMSALVFGVVPWDPVTFTVVTATLLVVAALATLVPAMRAARVSPIEAIRTD